MNDQWESIHIDRKQGSIYNGYHVRPYGTETKAKWNKGEEARCTANR
jgi:hypothetical protein